MATSKKKPTRGQSQKPKEQTNRRELYGILCVLLAVVALLCCFDTNAFLIRPCALFIGGLFGQIGRYAMPFLLAYIGYILFSSRKRPYKMRIFASVCVVLLLSAVVHLFVLALGGGKVTLNASELYQGGKDWSSGGLLPGWIAGLLDKAVTTVGALIVSIVLLILAAIHAMGMSVNGLINAYKQLPKAEEEPEGAKEERLVHRFAEKRQERKERKAAEIDIPVDDPPALPEQKTDKKKERPLSPDAFIERKRSEKQTEPQKVEPIDVEVPPEPMVEEITLPTQAAETETIDAVSGLPELKREPQPSKLKKGEAEAEAQEITAKIEKSSEAKPQEYVFPSLSLLHEPKSGTVDATAEMRENTRRLGETLKSFGIEPHIVNVIRGPSVTRYELELDRGVKLSRITNLADDIALSLGATGVRISAIPDRISVVGIEVPNKAVNTVYTREVIGSPVFRNSKSSISFAVGKDISGNSIVGDIAKLPHMLIAGTTGSGKSVCMNTLIISLLYKAKPEDVRLIMVDPKMVELGIYNGIPHLLIPVVTDPKKAAGALQWTVTEMMRRYRLMSELGVRDIDSYNKAVSHDSDEEKLAQVVVVIDELADLMLVAAKEVEESICRIAQMGRASGIHLVIATQRPSADVITGLMKANIPSRIAFAVSSAMESRIILDTAGAEKLVGKGDMLFAPLGQGKPKRVQGCFIDDDEVQAVIAAIKSRADSDYSDEIMEQIEKRAAQSGKGSASTAADSASGMSDNDGDELLPAAVEVILETGQASVSMLQRRLKLGYARAARIVDEMEEKGIVGPFEGAKPRQLLITKEQWTQMQNGTYEPNPPVEEEIP